MGHRYLYSPGGVVPLWYRYLNYFFFHLAAGQERFRALRTPFYRGSDICLLSYAVNDRDSFRGLKQWREEFLKYADVDHEHFPFIVVGNKVNKYLSVIQFSLTIYFTCEFKSY